MADDTSPATASAPPGPSPRPMRRTFLFWLTCATAAAATALLAIPCVGYLFGALRKHRALWIDLGPAGDFPLGETRLATFKNALGQPWDGMADRTGVYVRKEGGEQFLVFAMNCAHLGCPVTWFPQSGLFLCPCHGGVYYENGERASGPPPRGLFHCEWRVRQGNLEIRAPRLPTLQSPA
jgi:menaquinol-cytochrome c reductase iron-sulfur subunit